MVSPALRSVFGFAVGGDIENGVDNSTMGEDSDSLGARMGRAAVTPPAKENRKPFFRKVSYRHPPPPPNENPGHLVLSGTTSTTLFALA